MLVLAQAALVCLLLCFSHAGSLLLGVSRYEATSARSAPIIVLSARREQREEAYHYGVSHDLFFLTRKTARYISSTVYRGDDLWYSGLTTIFGFF